jgi:hypothetical protein
MIFFCFIKLCSLVVAYFKESLTKVVASTQRLFNFLFNDIIHITKYLDRSESIAAHSHTKAGQYATAHP